jgi:hypothetical protein
MNRDRQGVDKEAVVVPLSATALRPLICDDCLYTDLKPVPGGVEDAEESTSFMTFAPLFRTRRCGARTCACRVETHLDTLA